VDFGVGGEVDDDVEVGRVGDMAEAAAEVGERSGQVLQQVGKASVQELGRTSTPKTSWPRSNKWSARLVPIWPLEPVMRIRIGD